MQRKVQDAHDGLRGASDAASAQHGALAGRLKDLEQALAEAQAEARGARQDAAAAQAAAGDRGRLLEEATAALRHLEARHSAAEAGRATAEQQLAAEQRAKAELSTAVEQLQGRLSASASEAEARLAAEADARKQAEQACASAREILADEQKLRALDRKDAAERLAAHEASAAAAAERATAAAAAAADRAAAAAAAALDEAKRGLKKRLYLAEGEWAQRVQATAADWAQRCAAEEAARAAERAQLLHDMEARLGQVAAAQAAAVEDTKATYRRRVAVAEDKSAAATQAADRVWQQRLEAAVERAEREGQAAVASAARAAAQREQHLQAQLAAAQEGTAGRMAELDKQWALCLAAAEERGLRVSGEGTQCAGHPLQSAVAGLQRRQPPLCPPCHLPVRTPPPAPQERHELERQCADRLHAQERAAAEAQAALRSSLEARLASASERVGAIAQRQDRQERKRGECMGGARLGGWRRLVPCMTSPALLAACRRASLCIPLSTLLPQPSCCARLPPWRPASRASGAGARRPTPPCRWLAVGSCLWLAYLVQPLSSALPNSPLQTNPAGGVRHLQARGEEGFGNVPAQYACLPAALHVGQPAARLACCSADLPAPCAAPHRSWPTRMASWSCCARR